MEKIYYPHIGYFEEYGIINGTPIRLITDDNDIFYGRLEKIGHTPKGFQYLEIEEYPYKFLFHRIRVIHYDKEYLNDIKYVNLIDRYLMKFLLDK